MKSHVGLLFVYEDLSGKVTWTIYANKWHPIASELHHIYNIVYNIDVLGVTHVTLATCPIPLGLYKYLEL